MALLLTLGFCLMADAATGNDGKNYSVFQVILLSKNLRLTTDERFAWVVIWSKGFGRWLQLVVPVIVSLSFVLNSTEEKKTEHRYFLYSRENRFRYVFSKVTGAAFSAGLIFAISYLAFGLILLAFFPVNGKYEAGIKEYLDRVYGNGNIPIYMLKVFLGSFMYGIYACCFTIFLSIFISDRYVLLSIPVLFQYAVDVSIQKFWMKHMFSKYADAILALNMSNIIRAFSNKYWWYEFAGVWLLLILVGIVYYLWVKKEAKP